MRKLRDGNKPGEISKVGALTIELDQKIILCVRKDSICNLDIPT